MEFRKLGRTGLKVSTICLGTMQFGWSADEATSHRIMSHAIELGCNFFDTADVYSRWAEGNDGGVSEQIIGNWLAQSGTRRDSIVLATKVRGQMGDGPNDQGLSRVHIMTAVEDSLRRLQTDYIDLYQVHWPDEETPLDETLSALTDLVRAGKVRYIGCSNYPAWLLTKALWVSDVKNLVRFDSLQPHYSLVHRAEFERELQPLCLDQGIGVIPYSPLAGGFLTGKYKRGEAAPAGSRGENSPYVQKYMTDANYDKVEKLTAWAEERGHTMGELAHAWLLAQPSVSSVISGATKLSHVQANAKAADWALTAEEFAEVNGVLNGE